VAEPLVTAAILSYNRRDQLAVTLETLRERLDWPADRLEILVVDNASDDGTPEMVRERFPDVALIESGGNLGIAGWNLAFEAANGEWLLVLDDDCHISGDALRRAVAAAREHDAQMVSFDVDSEVPGVAFSDAYRTGLLSFWGCAVLLDREVARELRGFDADLFIWCHEVEFTMRFLDAGYRHLVMPEVRAQHMKPVPPVRVTPHRRNMRNWGYVAAKLLQPRDALLALGSLVVRAGIETMVAPGFAAGALEAVAGFRAGLRARKPVRPAVSRLYRRDFLEFTSQFRLIARLRHYLPRGGERPPNYREQFWQARERLYPSRSAALRVPLP
jgi:glycosyltransferase involved in cell wall biosynthesis